ncbi:MAG: exodeoxyribonuclease VII small subunit [Acidiferrobacterales bacterium]
MSKKNVMPDFEAALAELEKLVEKMESGEQSLEDALKSFQRGIELTRTCQQALKHAEQRVEKLVQKNDRLVTESLEINE